MKFGVYFCLEVEGLLHYLGKDSVIENNVSLNSDCFLGYVSGFAIEGHTITTGSVVIAAKPYKKEIYGRVPAQFLKSKD